MWSVDQLEKQEEHDLSNDGVNTLFPDQSCESWWQANTLSIVVHLGFRLSLEVLKPFEESSSGVSH